MTGAPGPEVSISPAPWLRAAVGAAGLAAIGLAVSRDQVGVSERVVFRWVNGLPDRLYPPAWAVMQAGTIGAAPAEAALAFVLHRRVLAGHLIAGGAATWLLAKVVKRIYQRPRPGSLVNLAYRRGAEQTGMGYVSGHAGIAVATAAAALPELPAAGRILALAAVPLVGVARVYVGAHLPLDVVGGAALGLAVSGVVEGIGDVLPYLARFHRRISQECATAPRCVQQRPTA